MPWSWVRVPTETSPALSNCVTTKEGPTRQAYADCIREIIQNRGGGVGPNDVKFEANGKWAHVHFEWASHAQKHQIMFDLDASAGIDLLTAADFDTFEQQENKPTT